MLEGVGSRQLYVRVYKVCLLFGERSLKAEEMRCCGGTSVESNRSSVET